MRLDALLGQVEGEKLAKEKLNLVRFGLREREAEAWLDQEPNYDKNILRSSDDFTHPDSSDDKVPEPRGTSLICQNCIVLGLEQ